MSSGQSLRNGSSVEPGLLNTRLMPKERSRSSVACLTVTDLLPLLPFFAMVSVSLCFWKVAASPRHCEEPLRRSNPDCHRGGILDCFATLAMTRGGSSVSPHRRALHGRLPLRVRGPQLHAISGLVGVDGELRALEQRLEAAIGKLLRRLAAVQLRRHLDDERCLQRPVKDQARIALDLGDVLAVVMDAVAVEGQRRI